MKKLIIIVSVVALSILGTPRTTSAAVWIQLIEQSSTEIYQGAPVGAFDEIGIFWQSGDQFSAPAFTDFTVAGWTNTNISAAEAYGTGPDSNFVRFCLNFNNVAPPPGTVFLSQTALNGQVIQRQILTYRDPSNNWWTWPEYEGTDADWHQLGGKDPLVVPEPLSFILLLTGCAGLIATSSRRRR